MTEPFRAQLPETEWRFETIPKSEQGLCFTWECLRCLGRPPDEKIWDVVSAIAVHASQSSWFQRFCRRDEFSPLKLLAWISKNSSWPDRPWCANEADLAAKLGKFGLIPPILDAATQARHIVTPDPSIEPDFMILQIPLFQVLKDRERMPPAESIKDPSQVFEMLRDLGAMQPVLINWHQYTKKQLVVEFKKWLDERWSTDLESLHSGGRVEIAPWLRRLGAYRIVLACKANPERLPQLKDDFQAQHHTLKWGASIQRLAQDFFERFLSELVPEGLRPSHPGRFKK